MQCAGRAVARSVLKDYTELRAVPDALRVLALVGKGHNGGDALIACGELLAKYPRAKVHLLMASEVDAFKPLAARAYRQLSERVTTYFVESDAHVAKIREELDVVSDGRGFHLCLDGLTGMSFQPPLRAPSDAIVAAVNRYPKIDLRAAVDLPSGVGETSGHLYFRADFTYATGIVKAPVLAQGAEVGRVRYLDLGFFDEGAGARIEERVLTTQLLEPFKGFRPVDADKRSYGHLFIIGGSTTMPGALLMTVLAAVRSGVGKVTVCAPDSRVPQLSAQVPEAMWVPMPETDTGTLSAKGFGRLEELLDRATAVLMGPGMGQHALTEILCQQVIYNVQIPMVLDADAIQSTNLSALNMRQAPTILTPHMGEFLRLVGESTLSDEAAQLKAICQKYNLCVALKGPHTRICDGRHLLWSLPGGPVLARGGSGDLLAGLIGGLLASPESDPMYVTAQGVLLHGMAADAWARDRGQHFVRTTELLDYLGPLVRGTV